MRRILWAIDAVVVLTWFFSYYLFQPFPGAIASWASLILLAGYLTGLWIAYPPARPRLQFDRASVVAIVCGVLFVAVLYEPILFVKSIYVPSTPASIEASLAYSALFGLFLQSFLFNGNMRGLFDRRAAGALALPFVLYIVLLLPLSTILALQTATQQAIMAFVITNLFGGSALFVVLLLLYVKSKFNSLPGVLFYFITAVPNAFTFLFAANLVLQLAWLFAAYGVVVLLVEFLLPTTWVERRIFPVARGPSFTSNRRATLATAATIGSVAVALLVVVPLALGTPHPFYADPTGSMAPQIEPGSLLIVHHVSLDSITVGQILVFNAPWQSGTTVAHEVIAVLHTSSGLEFRTQGIANPTADPTPVPAADVIGVVVLIIPLMGYLVLYSYVVLVVVAVGLGAYVAYSMAHPRQTHLRRPRALS